MLQQRFSIVLLMALIPAGRAWVSRMHPPSTSSARLSWSTRSQEKVPSSRLRVSSSTLDMEREAAEQRSADSSLSNLYPSRSSPGHGNDIVRGDDGVYEIENEQQHQAFLEANKDKLIVMKVGCQGLRNAEAALFWTLARRTYAYYGIATNNCVLCDPCMSHRKRI